MAKNTYQGNVSGKQIDEAVKKVPSLASKDGYYQGMTTGYAENLVGDGTPQSAEFSSMPTPPAVDDGSAAKVQKISGRSVVWNNLVKNPENLKLDFNGETCIAVTDTTFTYYQLNKDSRLWSYSHGYDWLGATTSNPLKAGHVIAFVFKVKNESEVQMTFQENKTWGTFAGVIPESNEIREYGVVGTLKGDMPRPYCWITTGKTITFEKGFAKCIDLTLMFGAGNEPSTYEEYLQRKPTIADEYAYETGRIVNTDIDGIKSSKDGAESKAMLPDEVKVFFPEGMRGVDSVADSVDFKNGVMTKANIARYVCTGSETIGYNDGRKSFYIRVSNATDGSERGKLYIVCNKYKTTTWDKYDISNEDLVAVLEPKSNPSVQIRDLSIATSDDFRNYIKNCYESGNPIEFLYITNDEPITKPLTTPLAPITSYENGEISTIVADGKESAPVLADIAYSINYRKQIEQNKADIEELKRRLVVAEASMASAASINIEE